MNWKSFLFIAPILLSACAPNDQDFDLGGLSHRHRILFERAGYDLNLSEPNAEFVFDNPRAISSAYYGQPFPAAQCTTLDFVTSLIGWQIVCLHSTMDYSDDCLYWISVHELKHVLGYGEGPVNPPSADLCTKY